MAMRISVAAVLVLQSYVRAVLVRRHEEGSVPPYLRKGWVPPTPAEFDERLAALGARFPAVILSLPTSTLLPTSPPPHFCLPAHIHLHSHPPTTPHTRPTLATQIRHPRPSPGARFPTVPEAAIEDALHACVGHAGYAVAELEKALDAFTRNRAV